MPKTRQRKKSGARKPTQNTSPMSVNSAEVKSTRTAAPTGAGVRSVRNSASEGQGIQSMVFPALAALGCYGMAFSFLVFYADPNRNLYAGMAAMMGIMWTISLALRVRKVRQARLRA